MSLFKEEQDDDFQDDSLIPCLKLMRDFPKIFFKLNFWIIILIAVQVAAIIFLCLYIPSLMRVSIVLALVWLLSAFSASLLFYRRGAAEIKCVWFVIIAALPVAGALIYLLASIKDKPHAILKINAENLSGISRAANELCGTCAASYERAVYFKSGTEFLCSALSDIREAKKRVYIEFFIIGRGHIFNTLLQAISEAKSNGAEIKVICDGVGSAFRINKKDVKKLENAGAEVKIFHKLKPFPHPKINIRDHRKIVAIDGKTAYTGGVNAADEYANIDSPFGYWKDTGVCVYGEAAKIFEGAFLAMWNGFYEMDAPSSNGKTCLPFYDSPNRRAFAEELFISEIYRANERVHILTPYFCVSDKLHAALSFAARRGVDVKVVIPHIPDKKYAFEVSKAFAASFDGSGARFYEYTPGFLHAKSIIFDNSVILGSYNFDLRSTRLNYECGIMFGEELCEEVEHDFDECLALSSPLIQKVNGWKKFYRAFLRFFAPLV